MLLVNPSSSRLLPGLHRFYKRHHTMKIHLLSLVLTGLSLLPAGAQSTDPARPNIIWMMIEDWSTDLSCYGTKGVNTPNIDQLAKDGIRYTQAFSTAPVCSASRSAMMTGFHQNYTGANQHRTADKKPLPYGIKPITHLLQEAGYYTCILDHKTDCNFTTGKKLFQGKNWSKCKPGQPFFAQYTFTGTHRAWRRDEKNPIAAKDIEIPPYYPDVPLIRRDWANGLEEMQVTDRQIGVFLKKLKEQGLADNTVILFCGDHGRCMPRGKQFLYDGGIHIPLIFKWPGKVKPGQVSDNMVMAIDISKTILDIAGAKSAHPLHGKNLLGEEVKQREYIFAARDKMDNTHDSMRAIRSNKFKYIQNLMPERPYCQFNEYKEKMYPTLAVMNAMHLNGELNKDQSAFMAEKKPAEELYDLEKDPFELNNLAEDPAYAKTKATLVKELTGWRKSINDNGPSEEFRKGGWPSTYPTKTKDQWNEIVKAWQPYVFRKPGKKARAPMELIRASALVKKGPRKRKRK